MEVDERMSVEEGNLARVRTHGLGFGRAARASGAATRAIQPCRRQSASRLAIRSSTRRYSASS